MTWILPAVELVDEIPVEELRMELAQLERLRDRIHGRLIHHFMPEAEAWLIHPVRTTRPQSGRYVLREAHLVEWLRTRPDRPVD